jgi:hypothetical protein
MPVYCGREVPAGLSPFLPTTGNMYQLCYFCLPILRFLGTGTAGVTNGAKASATLNGPISCAYDQNNNLYWVEQVGPAEMWAPAPGRLLHRECCDASGGISLLLCFDTVWACLLHHWSQLSHTLRILYPNNNTVATLGGTPGTPGYAGDGGPLSGAVFNGPQAVIVTDSQVGPCCLCWLQQCAASAGAESVPITAAYWAAIHVVLDQPDIYLSCWYAHRTSTSQTQATTASGGCCLIAARSSPLQVIYSIAAQGRASHGC